MFCVHYNAIIWFYVLKFCICTFSTSIINLTSPNQFRHSIFCFNMSRLGNIWKWHAYLLCAKFNATNFNQCEWKTWKNCFSSFVDCKSLIGSINWHTRLPIKTRLIQGYISPDFLPFSLNNNFKAESNFPGLKSQNIFSLHQRTNVVVINDLHSPCVYWQYDGLAHIT